MEAFLYSILAKPHLPLAIACALGFIIAFYVKIWRACRPPRAKQKKPDPV